MQVESMFDVPQSDVSTFELDIDVDLSSDWKIIAIVGASGSGKSSLAHELFFEEASVYLTPTNTFDWSRNAAIIDDFDEDISIKEVTKHLSSVGFGSVPNWLRPHHVLSTGEQFRANVARALAQTQKNSVCVIDEFTSVVDRQVAKVASVAIAKTVRRSKKRLVVVTCHRDIVDWLDPDIVIDTDERKQIMRASRSRPTFRVDIRQCSRERWKRYRQHHYMTASLSTSAKCFEAFVDDTPVAFTSYVHFPHAKTKNIKIGHRLVVLPDWQGIGIGGRLDDWLGQYLHDRGFRFHNVVAHPAMIAYYRKSARWKHLRTGRSTLHGKRALFANHYRHTSMQRITSSFAYTARA